MISVRLILSFDSVATRTEKDKKKEKENVGTLRENKKTFFSFRGTTMPLTLKHVARGIGGVDEMSLHLDESKVLFGVLRFVFGKGTFARTKYVACHFNGRELQSVSG